LEKPNNKCTFATGMISDDKSKDVMKTLFFDMDGVLVDFKSGEEKVDEATLREYGEHSEDIPGIFSLMSPIEGSVKAVKTLAKHYDVFILSTAPWRNPTAWMDKRTWITKYFHGTFYKKIILTHRKDLILGDYLIDDRPNNGASEFSGEWIQYGSGKFPNWDAIIAYLAKKDNW
jgi:FMN phosphatase YigB (HAD superfamily)